MPFFRFHFGIEFSIGRRDAETEDGPCEVGAIYLDDGEAGDEWLDDPDETVIGFRKVRRGKRSAPEASEG